MENMQNTIGLKEATTSVGPGNIVKNHLRSFQENNLEALMSDYTSKSVLITQVATYTGREEINAFFADLMLHFPKQLSSLKLDNLVVNEELVYIVWHAKTPSLEVPLGSDTFMIKDGKIAQQTFVGQLNFIPR